LTNQRNTRDQVQGIATKPEGKYEEQKRRDASKWRRECAIMKK
jgi:hypothetical protein